MTNYSNMGLHDTDQATITSQTILQPVIELNLVNVIMVMTVNYYLVKECKRVQKPIIIAVVLQCRIIQNTY